MRVTLLLCSCTYVLCCPFSKDIRIDSSVKSRNSGFHTELHVQVNISNLRRFLDCSIAYRQTIPSGAFLDLDSIRDNRPELHFYSPEPFDVEAPKEKSVSQTLYLCSHKALINNFIFQDSWILPVDLRYHSAATDKRFESVRVPHPQVLIRCEYDEIPQKQCSRSLIQASCDCENQSDLCTYVIIPAVSKFTTVKVPVGNKSHLTAVLVITFVVIALCFLFLVWPPRTNASVKNE